MANKNKYKPRADGRYSTRVWDGTYQQGKKHYKTLYADTSKELEKLIHDFERKVQNGEVTQSTEMTIYQYCENWVKNYKSTKEKSTQQMYERVMEFHLTDLKNKNFKYFTLPNVQGIINQCIDKPRTCQQIAMTLKQIGKSAEYDSLLPKGATDEIFGRIELPRYEAKEKRPLTDAEINTFKTHVWTPKQRLFLSVLYYCGLRREEAIALTWSDLQGDVIKIDKAYGFYNKKPYLKKPKSKNGVREVPIPSDLKKAIAECQAQMPSTELVFCMGTGEPMTTDSYRAFWRAIQPVFGTDVTAHIFRHNYCTRLCYAALKDKTITTKKIAELMGDNINMVNEVYSHILESQEDTLKAIESVF